MTENQGAEVLRKAIELQSQETEATMTEQSLRDAARELGIEDRFLEAALLDSPASDLGRKSSFWGIQPTQSRDLLVPGELTDDTTEGLIQALRRAFNETGTVNRRGGTMEWIATGSGVAETTVTFRQTGDQVRITLQRSLASGVALAIFLSGLAGLMASAVIGAKSHLPLDLAILAIMGVLAGLYFLTTWMIRSSSVRQEECIKNLLASMKEVLSQPTEGQPVSRVESTEDSQLQQRLEQS